MHVVFATDKNYLKHCAVALTSLLQTNPKLVERAFVIGDVLESDRVFSILKRFIVNRYGLELELLSSDTLPFGTFSVPLHFSKATYFPLLLDRLIPKEIDKVLFLDCDLIVVDDISELDRLEFEDETGHSEILLYASGVPTEGLPSNVRTKLKEMGFAANRYFNTGVMLVNLKVWRCQALHNDYLAILMRYQSQLTYADQDVLNIALQNRWLDFGEQYNQRFSDSSQLSEARIIHYIGPSKPWHLNNRHPMKAEYWRFRNMTPFRSAFSDDFSLVNVAKRLMPQFLKQTIKRLIGRKE